MKQYHKTLSGIVVAFLLFGAGCKDSTRAEFESLGSPHKVTVYSGGLAVRTFHATGNVSFQDSGTMAYFRDKDTGKLVEVSGTFTIEQE